MPVHVYSHIVGVCDLAVLVTDDRELQVSAADLVNILDPFVVALDAVCGETDKLDTALCKLGLELSKGTKLGGADGGEVIGMREEDDPVVTNELVEVDATSSGLGIKVGGLAAEAERLRTLFGRHIVKCLEVVLGL